MSHDVIVLGGGIAGISAAARLSQGARVLVIEGEEQLGYHSSGRSATFYHFGIGDRTVRALTSFSRPFFEAPPSELSQEPFCTPKPALFVARPDMLQALDELHRDMERFSPDLERIGTQAILGLVPVLKVGDDAIVAGVVDRGGRKLDANALLQAFVRAVKRGGGEVMQGSPALSIRREGSQWHVTTAQGDWRAPVLVNATGAWADKTAALAGVRPLGVSPLRRTIIVFDPPEGVSVADWPFVKSAVNEFYMLPEAGRLLASPVDEVPSGPVDAQPEDYDIALAAYRVEEYTTMPVKRIAHRWAGLRSFTADRIPTAGFSSEAPGFFWLAGQGGYGLQTAPAMAEATASLILGTPWPEGLAELGVMPDDIGPKRLSG